MLLCASGLHTLVAPTGLGAEHFVLGQARAAAERLRDVAFAFWESQKEDAVRRRGPARP